MQKNTLPSQITAWIGVGLISFILVFISSLMAVKNKMNTDSADESQRLIAGRIATYQEQLSIIASDYHNWTDVYLDAARQDFDQLSSNYGITAARGDVFQYAEMFDGPFVAPISWSAGHGLTVQPGILTAETRSSLRNKVKNLNFTDRETVDYFSVLNGQLAMFSASYLLPEDSDLLTRLNINEEAVAVIGRVFSSSRMTDIENEFFVSNLTLQYDEPSIATTSISLRDIDGSEIAWFSWTPPAPGDRLLKAMSPIIIGVISIFSIAACFVSRVLGDKARTIIKAEARSYSAARIDALTSLPNRLALLERLDDLCLDLSNEVAIIAIDLVLFKQINDTAGHVGGDKFLIEFSSRLRSGLGDECFVARYGGDEFFIIVSRENGIEDAIVKADESIDVACSNAIVCNNISFSVVASRGVSIRKKNESIPPDKLLRRADRAMYFAKSSGMKNALVFDDQMKLEDEKNKELEIGLRSDLKNRKNFEIDYQIITNNCVKKYRDQYEALARWRFNGVDRISPEVFIGIAEGCGLIVPLGWVLLDLVCEDMKRFPETKININISPTQLMVEGFGVEFTNRIRMHGICPSRIIVEITEQVAVRNDSKIETELKYLRRSGFKLALDDFGTGYSSIGYLTRMQFDILKIDRSFVRMMDGGARGIDMIKLMADIAGALNLKVVVEGVETVEQFNKLRELQIDSLQGYYLGRPGLLGRHENGVVAEL